MFFLLRMTFWLGLVCILLPGTGSKQNTRSADIDTMQAVAAAGTAYSDMRSFCERNPAACVVGGQVASALSQRAQDGAKTIVEFIGHTMSESKSSPASKGTLTASDTAPGYAMPASMVPLPPRRPSA